MCRNDIGGAAHRGALSFVQTPGPRAHDPLRRTILPGSPFSPPPWLYPNITNANRPLYDSGGGTLSPMLVGRKTGKSKLAIPLGKLTDYLGTWAKYPGVLRALLDYVLTTAGATGELSAGTETTTMQRQIAVAGENKITSRTSEAKLDKLTASLIRRALGYMTDTTDDALLTALGFRTARCETKLDFIERLVVLQLILRRGMEFKAANAGATEIPLFGFSVHIYNAYDWDASLTGAETANVASPQKKTAAQQLEDMENTSTMTTTTTTTTEANRRPKRRHDGSHRESHGRFYRPPRED